MSDAQVKVRFFTADEDASLHAPEAPLFVPVSLKRYGLSEVVNHLLDTTEAIPFDFLIDGVLLRTSLNDYLISKGLSSEASLQIEYTRAVLPPAYLGSFNAEDWVSSVDTFNLSTEAHILAGSYDGIVRTYNQSGEVQKQYVGHLSAVKAVKWATIHHIVSGSTDGQIRLWKTPESNPAENELDSPADGKTIAVLHGHSAAVVDLAVHTKSHRMLSAGQDAVVGLWATLPKEMTVVDPYAGDAAGAFASLALKKRRKMAARDASVQHRAPLALLEGHSQPVEGVIFDCTDSSVAYSVSQDHTIKTWDLVTSRCVDTRSTGFSLLSVAQIPEVNLIASGSSARHINLHDPRTQSGATERSVTKLTGHTNFVVSLATCPVKPTVFASASHDGTVKVWDIRSEKALHTISRESNTGKVFSVAWDQDIGIVSGGEDKRIQINSNP